MSGPATSDGPDQSTPHASFDRPIALVSDSTEFAGAEVYMAVLVETLRRQCSFVALLGEGAADETRLRLARAGAEVHMIAGLRRRPTLRGLVALLRALRRLDPSIVHLNLTDHGDGLAQVPAARLSGRPTVATVHLVLPPRTPWRELVSGFALRRIKTVIGVSAAVTDYLRLRGVSAIVVRNGLPPPVPDPDARAALGLEPSAFVVGGVGRLHAQKGWDILCSASLLVREERPDIVFVVVGDGPERERLVTSPRCQNVRFVGARIGAGSLITAFDVLVAPSRFEGLGLTPLEALFHGVPVIATDIDGLTELVGDCAVIVPPSDAEALAAAILRTSAEEELRADLAERGRRRAKDHFTAERMAAETLAAYRATAAGPRGALATVGSMPPPDETRTHETPT
jgi:glycosyltransferase involved in cell wall biosynthesis